MRECDFFTDVKITSAINNLVLAGKINGEKSKLVHNQIKRFIKNEQPITTCMNGRLYTSLNLMPKKIREQISGYVEVDLSNCAPYILACVLAMTSQKGQNYLLNKLTESEDRYRINKSQLDKLYKSISLVGLFRTQSRQENKFIKKTTKYLNTRYYSNIILVRRIYTYLTEQYSTNTDYSYKQILTQDSGFSFSSTKGSVQSDNSNLITELETVLESSKNGDFYTDVIGYYNINGLSPFCELKKKRPNILDDTESCDWDGTINTLTHSVKRDLVKKAFMMWVNGGNRNPARIIFKNIYPNICERISHIKKHFDRKILHKLITTLETMLIFSVVDKVSRKHMFKRKLIEGYDIGTIHDGLFIPISDKLDRVDDVIEQIQTESKKMFGVEPSVGIGRMELNEKISKINTKKPPN